MLLCRLPSGGSQINRGGAVSDCSPTPSGVVAAVAAVAAGVVPEVVVSGVDSIDTWPGAGLGVGVTTAATDCALGAACSAAFAAAIAHIRRTSDASARSYTSCSTALLLGSTSMKEEKLEPADATFVHEFVLETNRIPSRVTSDESGDLVVATG